MGSQKMTFTIPDDLAAQFVRRVPARDRSRYIAEALRAMLRGRETRLIESCEVANRSVDVRAVESEWESLNDRVGEPWADAPSR
jgi:hypothetical protein